MKTSHLNSLQCPKCSGDFQFEDDQLVCNNCSVCYKIDNQIVLFADQSSQLDKNRSDNHSRSESSLFYKFLLPENNKSNLLVFGCDDIKTVNEFVSEFENIWIVNNNHEILKELKKSLNDAKMIYIYHDYHTALPFKNNTFDSVIVDSNIKITQNLTDEFQRLLNSSGYLYFSAKNIFGRKREESRISLLLKSFKISKNNDENTIDINQLSSLLKSSGFSSLKKYGIEPDYTDPRSFIDLDDDFNVSSQKSNQNGLLKSAPLSFYKNTIPGFGIVAGKVNKLLPLYYKFIEKYADEFNYDVNKLRFAGSFITPKNKLILKLFDASSKNYKIIKLPISKEAESACFENIKGLSIVKNADRSVSNLISKNFGSLSYHENIFFFEDSVDGKAASDKINDFNFEDLKDSLADFFIEEHKIHPTDDKNYKESEVSLWQTKLEFLKNHNLLSKNIYCHKLDKISELIVDEINITTKKPVFRKNDFSLSNVYLSDNRISGIIDFDEFTFSHFYLLDFCDFIYSYLRYKHNLYWSKTVPRLYKGNYNDLGEDYNFKPILEKLALTEKELQTAFLLSWLDHTYLNMQVRKVYENDNRVNSLLVRPLEVLEI